MSEKYVTGEKEIKPLWIYQVSIDNHNFGRSFESGVISQPISKIVAIEMLEKHYINSGVLNIISLIGMDVPNLSENELVVLKEMLLWDSSYALGYSYLDETRLDRKTLQKCIKHLREIGLVKMSRGGINDDGELCSGTGFYIPYEMIKAVETLTEQGLIPTANNQPKNTYKLTDKNDLLNDLMEIAESAPESLKEQASEWMESHVKN